MNNKFIMTDGTKTVNLLLSDDPAVWTNLSSPVKSDDVELYARVSAAFRAYNLKANTVGNIPFCLYEENGAEYDNSATWENKVGFLPNPSELFRLDTLSYMATNTIYNLRTSDALGYKVKGLYYAVPYFFKPWLNPATLQLDYIERQAGGTIERYQPEDKHLVRMWRLDHTTEVLPSPNTEARAIMNAAGIVYFADAWIKHFYERGGVAPTVIGMKGAVSPDKKAGEEKTWRDWILGLGSRFRWNPTRVVNLETLEVKQFGSSVTDLKNNEVYREALSGIAMGTGMPLSLMLSNSANYATAREEKATWFESDLIPFVNWLGYEYNRQVFHPLGLYLEFHPETLDPQQEDETERASAVNTFMDFLSKCPTFDIFIGTAETFGYELSDSLIKAAKKYYADKEAQAEQVRQQMQTAGVVIGPDNKPIEQEPKDDEQDNKPAPFEEKEEDEDDEEEKPKPTAKWIPTLNEYKELSLWQDVMVRRFKKGQSMRYEYQSKYGGLPVGVIKHVDDLLLVATDIEQVKAAFDVALLDVPGEQAPTPENNNDLRYLGDALNKYAEALFMKQVPAST